MLENKKEPVSVTMERNQFQLPENGEESVSAREQRKNRQRTENREQRCTVTGVLLEKCQRGARKSPEGSREVQQRERERKVGFRGEDKMNEDLRTKP